MANSSEALYEFNAPQHYFDFKERINEEPDDSYFDCQEGGPLKLETPKVESGTPKPLRSSSRHNAGISRTPLPSVRPKKAQNSIGTPKRPKVSAVSPKKSPVPLTMDVDDVKESEDKENVSRMVLSSPGVTEKKVDLVMQKRTRSFSPAGGIRSSPRLSAIAKALRRSNAARRSGGFGSQRSSSGGSNGAHFSVVNKQKTQNKPSVPKVRGMKGLSEKDCSELQMIATFKQKIVNNKKKPLQSSGPCIVPTVPLEFNFATDSRLRQKNPVEPSCSPRPAPARKSRQGSTVPQEFHFATDARVQKHSSAEEEEEAVSFPQFLRSGSSVTDKDLYKGPTIPQPFNLTESRKGATGIEANKFVSVAELNLKFHTRTPQRFRSRRSDDVDEGRNKRSKPHPGVTIPVTPAFSTRTRSRKVSYLSREEMEQKEFEEEQKKKFKANPVNKKIFEAPTGYQVERKQSTIPEPFNITKTKKEEAAPLGANFKEMCNKLGCSVASIASLPWGGVPSKWEKSSTKLQPFSFDSRDKEKLQRKHETIQKVIDDEKKLAEFHAHPMPIFEDGIRGVPLKKPPTPTRSRPFNLRSDQRGEFKKEQFKRTVEEQERLDNEKRRFHATSDTILHKDPFIPEKSMKALTDISGFTLNTEIRAEARTAFELHQKQKEDELLAAKEELEARRAAEEAAEIARLRREAIHKANPVPNYKPLEIKPAPCPPTVPISPKLVTKSRLRSKMNSRAGSVDSTMNMSSATFTTE